MNLLNNVFADIASLKTQQTKEIKSTEPKDIAKGVLTNVVDRQSKLLEMYDDMVKDNKMKDEDDSRGNITSPNAKVKKFMHIEEDDEGLKGGTFVKQYSANFDLIINILINIRRSLSNLVESPSNELLETRLFEQKITTITDYVSNKVSNDPMYFRFTDFAPFVF